MDDGTVNPKKLTINLFLYNSDSDCVWPSGQAMNGADNVVYVTTGLHPASPDPVV